MIVSRLKHSEAWQPLTNWTAENSCQDSQWQVWVRAGAHHLGVGQYEALWVTHHTLRLLILAQMNGNCLRHSRTISSLRLTSSPVPERTLNVCWIICSLLFNSHSPVQSSSNTQPYITPLHSYQHQCNDILIQCCSRRLNEMMAVHILLMHFCQRLSASYPGIWFWTHFLIARTWHYHRADAGSALDVAQ